LEKEKENLSIPKSSEVANQAVVNNELLEHKQKIEWTITQLKVITAALGDSNLEAPVYNKLKEEQESHAHSRKLLEEALEQGKKDKELIEGFQKRIKGLIQSHQQTLRHVNLDNLFTNSIDEWDFEKEKERLSRRQTAYEVRRKLIKERKKSMKMKSAEDLSPENEKIVNRTRSQSEMFFNQVFTPPIPQSISPLSSPVSPRKGISNNNNEKSEMTMTIKSTRNSPQQIYMKSNVNSDQSLQQILDDLKKNIPANIEYEITLDSDDINNH